MRRRHKISFTRIVIGVFVFVVLLGFAARSYDFLSAAIFGETPSGSAKYDLTIERVIGIITGLSCWLADIALLLMVGAIIIYGLQIMLSRGDASKFQAAKESLKYAIVGAVVILGVYTIIATVAQALGADVNLIPLQCSGF